MNDDTPHPDDVLAHTRAPVAPIAGSYLITQSDGRAQLEQLQLASGLTRTRFGPVALGRDRRTVERWRSARTEIPEVMLDWLARAEIRPATPGRPAMLCILFPLPPARDPK